jgi:hypothetical protein
LRRGVLLGSHVRTHSTMAYVRHARYRFPEPGRAPSEYERLRLRPHARTVMCPLELSPRAGAGNFTLRAGLRLPVSGFRSPASVSGFRSRHPAPGPGSSGGSGPRPRFPAVFPAPGGH